MLSQRPLILVYGVLILCLSSLAVAQTTLNNLFLAARNDNPEQIRAALEDDGIPIDDVGPGGQTPLLFSILSGRYESVKFLLQNGADVKAVEKDGYNVLHAAGFQGRKEILDELLLRNPEIRAMVMVPHKDGYYPMHRACWGREQRHADTVKVFAERGGVDINLKAENGKTCKEMTSNEATLTVIEQLTSDGEL